MTLPKRTFIAVVAALGVITAGTATTIAVTTEPTQSGPEQTRAVQARFRTALETYATAYTDKYGALFMETDAEDRFCGTQAGSRSEQVTRVNREYPSASTSAILQVQAIAFAYGICPTY